MDNNKIDDKIIFDTITFTDLIKTIYSNSDNKKSEINDLVYNLKSLIGDAKDAALIVPLIKDCIDLSIKNDEHLIKMANVLQKHIASDKRADVLLKSGGNPLLLSADEQKELLKIASDELELEKQLQAVNDKTKQLTNKNDGTFDENDLDI